MKSIKTKAGLLYQSANLKNQSWINHGFGTRGVLLEHYLSHFGYQDVLLAKTNQIHGSDVHVLDTRPYENIIEGDAFITNSKYVVCFVRTADCVPILLCDPDKRVIGAVHAGWRGILSDVIGSTINKMSDTFQCDASKVIASIGPCICSQCYDVEEDVIDNFKRNGFEQEFWKYSEKRGKFLFDLRLASIKLLKLAGVLEEKISMMPLCTSCQNGQFSSYRKDRSEDFRQVNFILIF